MIFCFRHFAPKRRVHRTFAWKRAAFAASVSGIAALTACGGGTKAANLSPTTPPTANLNVASNLPGGTQGSAYNGSVTASGGTPPYSYAVTSGQMPGGVSLDNSTGKVTGTPTAAGNFNFGVSVSDASGASTQQPLQIAVAQAAAAPAPTPPPPSPPPSSPAPPSSPPPSSPSPGSNTSTGTLSNLQNAGGWGQYGQGPPNFVDCSPSPCEGIAFSMTQGSTSPSLSI